MGVQEDYILAFQRWCAMNRKAAVGPRYVKYLGSFNLEYAEPTHTSWDGLYVFAYGHKASKEVVEISSLHEFETTYGIFRLSVLSTKCPDGMNIEHYRKILDWLNKPEVRGPSCLNAALNAYRDFLIWMAIQNPVLTEFDSWLSSSECNNGKGYTERTKGHYLKALVFLNSAMRNWGVDPEDDLWMISSPQKFDEIESRIRACPEFPNYNNDKAPDGSSNVNGTGAQDPSAALRRLGEFIKIRSTNKKVDVNDGIPSSADRLTVVLKLFAERRKVKEPSGCLTESFVTNGKVRECFGSITKEQLEGFTEKDLKEFFCKKVEYPGTGVAYENMWSGKNGQGWGNIKPNSDEELNKVKDYMVRIHQDASIAATFLLKGGTRQKGFGPGVVSELLMKFHPECCFKHGSVTRESLNFLGLANFTSTNSAYDECEYKIACGAAALILARMKAMKLPRAINLDGSEDSASPDYLTVNEFIWFVSKNKDLIKERVMKEQLKPIEAAKSIKKGTRKLSDAFKDDTMLQRLAAALRTKPFAILAGHSGTGKSQLVRRLAYMTCNNEKLMKEGEGKTAPGNYCMVQVKPNWHDSTDLIGYYSDLGGRHFVNTTFVQFLCKAYAYPQTPFFLCLDEMNLAPVEQYFAEYLSAVESMDKKDGAWLTDSLVDIAKEGDGNIDKDVLMQIMRGAPSVEAADWITKHGLTIPKNLFVVGTVNMDETTCQFSRKVLDRAMTLLMNEVKFVDMGKTVDPSREELLDEDGINFFLDGARKGMVGTDEVALLDKVNEALKNTPFVIAYRFANEYALYEAALAKLRNVESVSSVAADAMDHVVLMKLLPRIHGERAIVKDIFTGENTNGGLCAALGEGLSKTQMEAILARKDEYLTFWP